MIAINGRYTARCITGVERYAHEISKRLTSAKYSIKPQRPLGQVTGHLWEQFILPGKIQNDSILWSPANAGPWIVRNQIITIHDASVFDHPEWFNPAFGAWTRLSWKILAKRVKSVITVSNFSRDRLKFHLGIPEEKIHVIYNGVGKPFGPQSQKSIELVKAKCSLNKPYFLFVSTNEPRKNLAGLIRAWEKLNLESYSFFVAGAKGKVFAPVGQIANLTYASDEDLPALYSGAAAVVVPSFYEGFGLTVLEAMACGAPVIASDIPVFREIFDGAVMFTNPYDSDQIANAIQEIIGDESISRMFRENGFKRAANLSWDESAQRTQILLERFQ